VSLTLQILLSGLAAGSAYGLIAIGYVVVYRLTGIVHFALGEFAALGVFIALFLTVGRGPTTAATASSGRFAVALLVALVVVGAVGAGSYFAVIHPYLVRYSTLGWVAATIAIAFAIQSSLSLLFGRPAYVFPDALPFDRIGREGTVSFAGAVFQVRSVFVIGLGVVLALAISLALQRTRFGRGLEAIAADVEGARLVGVPVDRFIGMAFGIVGALAVVIAIAAAPSGPFSVNSGTLLGLKGLLAALVVGFTSAGRAFAAGLVLGVVETAIASGHLFGYSLGTSYREVLPLGFVLLLLAFRGRGLALSSR
jgi:branched-chain amino acid transport system permease protein